MRDSFVMRSSISRALASTTNVTSRQSSWPNDKSWSILKGQGINASHHSAKEHIF